MIKTKRVTIFTLMALVALNVALAFAVVGNRAEKTYAADIFEYRGLLHFCGQCLQFFHCR